MSKILTSDLNVDGNVLVTQQGFRQLRHILFEYGGSVMYSKLLLFRPVYNVTVTVQQLLYVLYPLVGATLPEYSFQVYVCRI